MDENRKVKDSGHIAAVNEKYLSDQETVVKQHAPDNTMPSSPYMSVTSNPRVSGHFAKNGVR